MPVRAEYRGLPAVPADQVVTGLIPHEPPNFQTPAALGLLSEPVCVVTGPRGVGKTQLAAAYARGRVRDGWLVAWIGAETADQITAGMVELGPWRIPPNVRVWTPMSLIQRDPDVYDRPNEFVPERFGDNPKPKPKTKRK